MDLKRKSDQKVAIMYAYPADPVEVVPVPFHRSLVFLAQYDAIGQRLSDGRKVGGRRHVMDGGAIFGLPSGPEVAKARNRLVREFLKLDCDWLLMVDTDMTFEPNLVDRLLEAAHPIERPIVGGLCFAYHADLRRKFWPTIYVWQRDTDVLRQVAQYPEDSLVQVAGTGAACLLLHRSVLLAMGERFKGARPWFDCQPYCKKDAHGEPVPDTWDEYSEDLTFCLRAQACGYPIYVATGIKLGHLKEFEANEAAFLAETAGLVESSTAKLPTFAVIPSRSRLSMVRELHASLLAQGVTVFVYDNGYAVPPITGAINAHGWALHRMWNDGLARAEAQAGAPAWNVLVINDDVKVAPDFVGRLEEGLRSDDRNWLAYPDVGQGTMTGWAYMVRGESGLRIDERFEWWYGDTDLERQAYSQGARAVVVPDAGCEHVDPNRSTFENPERLAQAEGDEARFAEKWGVDPASLYLAQRRVGALQ